MPARQGWFVTPQLCRAPRYRSFCGQATAPITHTIYWRKRPCSRQGMHALPGSIDIDAMRPACIESVHHQRRTVGEFDQHVVKAAVAGVDGGCSRTHVAPTEFHVTTAGNAMQGERFPVAAA